ncbi:unnamed protein product [marine sediment metagenome]|uniref:Uncharacterized protein n=1 Tax=marine sediment metagenome TaxID=412755 RepID=X1HQE6_9ZZZZ
MATKQLYDNLYKVIKANSGEILQNDNTLTEIMDLQIPRGWCARIRRVIFQDHSLTTQVGQARFKTHMALVLDPDDEESYHIPMFTVDHDVLCDAEHEYMRFELDATPNGISVIKAQKTIHDFPETLDAVTVRNVRFNTQGFDTLVTDSTLQTRCTVYFTYEKVSMDLYSKLLGIS